MRIAYIAGAYARASDTFIRNEVVELRARGHDVFTFSIRRDANVGQVGADVLSEQASTNYILENPKSEIIAGVLRGMFGNAPAFAKAVLLAWRTSAPGLKGHVLQFAYLIEAAYLAHCLQQLKIDILHNHIAENTATVAMLASEISGVPFSMTVHGPGIFYHPRKWALGEKIARSAFTATITNFCKSQCMLFSDQAAWAKLHVVRCSAGRRFEGQAEVPIPDAPRLVFVGRLCAEKGVPILLEAVSTLAAGGQPCEVVLVGDGPLRGEIEQMITGRKLQANVKILGWQSSERVRAEIEKSRALVVPSFAEGLPIVVMEAFAMGRPVVSTQVAGIPELVQHGQNGWLVAPGSAEALAGALAEAARMPAAEIAQMGRTAAADLRRMHDFTEQMNLLEGLLKDAARAKPVRGDQAVAQRWPDGEGERL
ncbi:MAG: glycosyltransferase [Hyphomicrobiaceae bacterium]|nr:glycosyltransferase [Hyphomicrobiaceae bacterium]